MGLFWDKEISTTKVPLKSNLRHILTNTEKLIVSHEKVSKMMQTFSPFHGIMNEM